MNRLKAAGGQAAIYLRQKISEKTGHNVCRPGNIYVNVTMQCNSRCKMCSIWSSVKAPEPNADELTGSLKKLFRWLPTGAKINLSGGEPLVKRGLLDILSDLRHDMGPLLCGITTNALLIDDERAKQIMGIDLFNINISLDSADPKVHDYLRGIDGAFNKVMNAIERLSYWKKRLKAGTKIILKTIICKQNVGQLNEMQYLLKKNKVDGIYFQPVEQNFNEEPDDGWYRKSSLWPTDMEEVRTGLNDLITLKSSGLPILNSKAHILSMVDYFRDPSPRSKGSCSIGYTTLFIWQDGTAYLCTKFGSIGNILTDDPHDIWNGKRASDVRRAIARCGKQCLLTCQIQTPLWEKAKAFLTLAK